MKDTPPALPPPDLVVGTHEVRYEGDLVRVTLHGAFTLEDMKRFFPVNEAHSAQHGYSLLLVDLDDAKSLSSEARRYAAEQNREAHKRGPVYGANATFGGSMLMRGTAALLLSMMRLVGGGGIRTHLTATEADARAFLAEQRRRFRAQLGLPPV